MKIDRNSWHYKIRSVFGFMPLKFPMTLTQYWAGVVTAPIWYPMFTLMFVFLVVMFPFIWTIMKFQDWIEKKVKNYKKKNKSTIIEGLEEDV